MSVQSRSLRRAPLILAIIALLVVPLSASAQGPGPSKPGVFPPGLAKKVQASAQTSQLQAVASGLDNPRGLAFGPEGALYVAEAGRGGVGGNCIPSPEDPTVETCPGSTGAITRIDLKKGTQQRIATGLPSIAGADGSEASGPSDISFQGRGNGYTIIGLGGDPAVRELIGPDFGNLAKVPASGKWQLRADVAGHEASANPDGGEVDSNPYSVAALPDGNAAVADAGANALLHVNVETGAVQTLAVFPDRVVPVDPILQGFLGLPPFLPAQAVPNSVVVGPDGALYVGQLLGFPFTPGESKVYRVAPGQAPQVYAEGFTAIIDIAFDRAGNLYVLEIAKNSLISAFIFGDWTGALIKVPAGGGPRTEVASAGLWAPGGVTVGPDGVFYVSNNSIWADTGEVVKIMP